MPGSKKVFEGKQCCIMGLLFNCIICKGGKVISFNLPRIFH